MRISLITTAVLLAIALPALAQAPPPVPMLNTVEPASGKVGDAFAVQGENLDAAYVAALYLTDGKNDTKVTITEQTAAKIAFTVPAGTAAGRYALMILTKGKVPRYIEMPVKLTLEGETPIT
jgi:hypothetical protein